MLFWFFGSYVISLVVYLLGMTFEVAWWFGLLVIVLIAGLIVLCGYLVSKKRKQVLKVN